MLLLLVTLSSVLLAAVMSAIAWRLSYEERRRSEARVAALAAEIHGDVRIGPAAVAQAFKAASSSQARPARAPSNAAAAAHLFESPSADAGAGRLGVTIGAGALVLAGAVAAVLLVPRHVPEAAAGSPVADASSPAAPTEGAAAARAPLELIALAHERDGDQLIVRGVVRNPASAAEVDKLTAVVFVFAQDGAFIGSSRAAVASSALAPGGESTFLVTVGGARDVSRYRVSFRAGDATVPHVDRRERPQEKG